MIFWRPICFLLVSWVTGVCASLAVYYESAFWAGLTVSLLVLVIGVATDKDLQ